ncbi:AAA family ATPase [Aequorivita capsosiphonis]|uniref:AAA family ATPase n=1 Tax=Aequorivita capsosiphonis TaxID=487317 RepID=UPI0003F96F6C|nr:ATP-binding protein [Aequorivita capsosiphonis]
MKTERIVITGGPGSGKTALIKHLEDQGHQVMHEISREVTLQAQKEGIEQLFLENPMLFSEKLLEGRLKQFREGENRHAETLFYDRGMPDVTAYMDFMNIHYPENFSETCNTYRYDKVFVLPPWKEIYEQDNERYESFEQAEELFNFLKNSYEYYGYNTYEVPVGSIKERAEYILEKVKDTF